MSSTIQSHRTAPLTKGAYYRANLSDLRSPCPLINCLANHGYISRDGREIHASELSTAMKEAGLSTALRAAFVNPVFLEQVDSRFPIPQEEHSIFGYVWYLIRNPWALFFSKLGMRRPGQKDSMGRKCLNLNQLALHGIVEHDVSLTRYDYNQGDNHSPQPNLIQELLASSADGKTLTADDLAALRKRRIEEQKQDNPELKYGSFEHTLGCGEIALILNVLGDGQSVPCDYIRAFFEEERLPVEEGWAKRSSWWPFGLVELVLDTTKIKRLMGIKV